MLGRSPPGAGCNRNVKKTDNTSPASRSCHAGERELAMAGNQQRGRQAEPEKEPPADHDGEKRKPDFTLRARQGPGSKYFYDVGAAWKIEIDGEEALSISLFTSPLPDPDPYKGKGKISMIGLKPKPKKENGGD